MRKPGQIIYRCRLSIAKQRELIRLFSARVTGCAAARLVHVDKKTALRIFRLFRKTILWHRLALEPLTGTVAVDEMYLRGAPHDKNRRRRGRSLDGKFAIIGAAQRDPETGVRHLRLAEIKNVSANTLCGFVVENVARESTVHTDQFPAYAPLEDLGFKHLRVVHRREWKNKTTGACTDLIESVWSHFKRHLRRFSGGWRYNLTLWLAEEESRWECGETCFQKSLCVLLRKSRTVQLVVNF